MNRTDTIVIEDTGNTIIDPSLADTYAEIFLDPVFQFEVFLEHSEEDNYYTETEFNEILYGNDFNVFRIVGAVADPKRFDEIFFARFKCDRGSILHCMFNSFIAGMDAEKRMEAMARETEEEGAS